MRQNDKGQKNQHLSRRQLLAGTLTAGAGIAATSLTNGKIFGDQTATSSSSTPATEAQILNKLALWYKQPAVQWTEALPIGNGRLGAMIFGGVESEHLQLNEDTVWEGYKRNVNNPASLNNLPQIRQLIFENKCIEATNLITQTMLAVPPRIRSYQPLCDLLVDLPLIQRNGISTGVQNYRRSLNLQTGVATVQYQLNGGTYTREMFASAPDNVIVVRFSCDQLRQTNSNIANISMTREKDAICTNDPSDPHCLILKGQIIAQYANSPPTPAERFEAQLLVIPSGKQSITANGGKLFIATADSFLLLIAGATDYHGDDPDQLCRQTLAKAATKTYDDLLAAHLADYQKLFQRVDLDIGPAGPEVESLPTDERITRLASGQADPGLVVTYFQYARYLLISCSRPGSMPANLQGMWNDKLMASWNSDYHTNINIQMNYWPAEVCNLSECHQPLFDLIEMLVEPGSQTAKEMYGCRGWVVHHLTDPYGFTAPADSAVGVWPMGGAWMCQHLWEHYAFSGDKEFLTQRAYPLMSGSARFIIDYLVVAPDISACPGKLVSLPSVSPENKYKLPNGQVAEITYAPTMDLEIIHDLLTHCIEASQILGIDEAFRAECQTTLDRLPPLQISKKDGRLLEWIEEFTETDIHHRHTSHLFAVYPGDQITLKDTPELAAAARKSLIVRGDMGAKEWSMAWRSCLWSRFLDAQRAWGQLARLMATSLYPNLFNKYPPFQIDGNLGAAAAIGEILLQSQRGEISLVPALPKAWPSGSVKGLRARGGFTVNMSWMDGTLLEASLTSTIGSRARVRTPVNVQVSSNATDQFIAVERPEPNVVVFPTQANMTYILRSDADNKL
ncbi:MAG TPA: glycoside hydrolase family 95 protein [Phycisphaerae bacterium]|nr:glycoside hydrolase family 95 protein [Phycisphaerae bacterium]